MRTNGFEINEEGRLSAVEFDDLVERWNAGEGPFWADLQSSEQAEWFKGLAQIGLTRQIAQALNESGHAPRVLSFDEALMFEIPTRFSGDLQELRSATFICFDRLVVTLRGSWAGEAVVSVDDVVDRVVLHDRTAGELVCALLVEISIELRHRSSDLRRRTMKFARRMDARPDDISLDAILRLKRQIVDFDAVTEERAAVLQLLEPLEHPVFDLSENLDALRVAVGNTQANLRRLDRLDRRAADLQLRYDANQQEKTNRRLSRLTVISAIFLPLTLIAGIYGMNFESMPELRQDLGYPVVLAGMGAIAVAMLWWFRVRGWME